MLFLIINAHFWKLSPKLLLVSQQPVSSISERFQDFSATNFDIQCTMGDLIIYSIKSICNRLTLKLSDKK